MRFASFYLLFILLAFNSYAQKLSAVCVKTSINNTYIRYIEIRAEGVLLRMNADGQLKIKGIYNNQDIEYYTQFDGLDNIGKLKRIGNTHIGYFDRFDISNKTGSLKAIGKLNVTYYTRFDGLDNVGKLKSIGNQQITYYDRFTDLGANTGKLKSIGNTTITYFSRFDGQQNIGEIKSIDGDSPYLFVQRD